VFLDMVVKKLLGVSIIGRWVVCSESVVGLVLGIWKGDIDE
jgi:hypothetical protein